MDNGGQPLAESIENDANDYGDANGHGTHVCGVVGAQANNNVGVAGSSYNASIIPMRVLDASGNGTTSTVVKALYKVLDLKKSNDDPVNIRVVNLSLGGEGSDQTINQAIADLADNDVLCVCAAGNESSTADFTSADAPQALSVKVNGDGSYSNKDSSSAGVVNAYKAVAAAQNAILQSVGVPTAIADLVYTGLPQTGVTAHDGYTLLTVPYDPEQAEQGMSTTSETAHKSAKETNAGHYRTTAHLVTGYQWEDGTTEDKVVEWSIAPAKLKLIYGGAKVMVGDNASNGALNITITGFVNGESAATLAGFVTPGLVQVTGNVSPADANNLVISSNDLSAMADPSAYKPLDDGLTKTPGAKTLAPISKDLAGIDPTKAGNPTSNYEFSESQRGTLDVYGRATAPTKTDYTYNGQVKQGVRGGANCTVTGTSSATAAGTYTAKATPNDRYIWSDKTLSSSDKASTRTYTWKISAASIAGAMVSGIGNVTYSGRAATPTPTVRLGTRTLTNGTDYTVAYRNNVNAGTATATITGKGNYVGTLSRNFSIYKATLVATYAGGTMNVGANPPTTVNVTEFVGDQNARTATGYRAPTVSISADQRSTVGTYTITPSGGAATNYNFTYRAGTLRVVAVPVSTVALNRTSLSLKPGTSASIVATVSPSNATNKAVTWKSSNTGVATVNGLGVVTALSRGTTTITATSGGRSATCTVTVATPAAHVAYRTHVQNVGWQSYVRDGAMSGTSGRALRLEGINIKLEGQPYTGGIEYRTYVQSKGWMGWAKNGAQAGSAGFAYRLEGINIVLVPKGGAAPGPTAGAFVQR